MRRGNGSRPVLKRSKSSDDLTGNEEFKESDSAQVSGSLGLSAQSGLPNLHFTCRPNGAILCWYNPSTP